MNYTVHLSAEAERNRDCAYLYYLERTQQGAYSWFAAYERAVQALASDPERYAVARENEQFPVKLQQLNFGTQSNRPTHRLVYYVKGTDVYVVTLRHLHQRDLHGDTTVDS